MFRDAKKTFEGVYVTMPLAEEKQADTLNSIRDDIEDGIGTDEITKLYCGVMSRVRRHQTSWRHWSHRTLGMFFSS